MERALFHAARGAGRTSPNPLVGAVVVSADGVVVGQGFHQRAGEAHAEVRALAEAGARARGATLVLHARTVLPSGTHRPVRPAHRRRGRRPRGCGRRGPESGGSRTRIRVSPRARRDGGRRPCGRSRGHAEPAVLHAHARGTSVCRAQGGDEHRRAHRRSARTPDAPDVGCRESPCAASAGGSGRHWRRQRHDLGRRSGTHRARRLPRTAPDSRHLRPAIENAAGCACALDTRGRACHHRDDGRRGSACRPASGAPQTRRADRGRCRRHVARGVASPRRAPDRIAAPRRRRGGPRGGVGRMPRRLRASLRHAARARRQRGPAARRIARSRRRNSRIGESCRLAPTS